MSYDNYYNVLMVSTRGAYKTNCCGTVCQCMAREYFKYRMMYDDIGIDGELSDHFAIEMALSLCCPPEYA